jgi:hypothetical protein
MKGHVIDLNWHLAISFWVKKIKVTLECDVKRQLSLRFLLVTTPKTPKMCFMQTYDQ